MPSVVYNHYGMRIHYSFVGQYYGFPIQGIRDSKAKTEKSEPQPVQWRLDQR